MPAASHMTVQQLMERIGLIIVPTEAAAQQLRNQRDADEMNSGLRAWVPANVLTWDQWIRAVWSDSITAGKENRMLLNAAQEHLLWRDIIQDHKASSNSLASLDSLAELAATAWRLSESFGVTARLRQYATTHDARIFADWAEHFQSECLANGFLSRASLEKATSEKRTNGSFVPTTPLTFAGFPHWNTSEKELLTTLRRSGDSIDETRIVAEGPGTAQSLVLSAENPSAELHAVAHWIREFLTIRPAATPARIGVLVPDLDASQDRLADIFREVLAPELLDLASLHINAPYEIARQESLHSDPLVAVALDLIRWCVHPLSRHNVSALLLSPYLTPASATERVAQFDARYLRQAALLRPEVDLRWLAGEVGRRNFSSAIAWPNSLLRFLERTDTLRSTASHGQWAEFMRRLLAAAGWPGEQLQTSQEVATIERLHHTLDNMATLDFASQRVSFDEALRVLERLAAKPSTRLGTGLAPVQILRPKDAHGLTFDALILANATEEHWPRLPAANPLIGWQLQASAGMPGTNRSADFEKARELTGDLLSSAETRLFSFHTAEGDTRQRLSPLVSELNLQTRAAADIVASTPTDAYIEPDIIEDTDALPPLPSPQVHGGATVLQYQAACGFRAFAEIRLRAQELEEKEVGFDARERGNLLHKIMQQFWAETKSQRTLRSMTTEARRELLKCCIDTCVSSPKHTDHSWDSAYIDLQKHRLVRLLNQWLEAELARGDFEVLGTELEQNIIVGPLDLKVRVDRIDKVDAGVVLVDYKTSSSVRPSSWEGERPDEPQLPLYSMLPDDSELAGVAFAKVRPGQGKGWQGYAAAANIFPGRIAVRDMAGLQEEWRLHLAALAEAFASGDTSVAPKSYPATCTYCAQRLLCRLDTAALLDTSDSDEILEEEQA